MARRHRLLDKVVAGALSGEGAHVATESVFSGLDWRQAGLRPRGVPHSLYQLLNHMVFWQEWVLGWLKGQPPPMPRHAPGGWPGAVAPASRREWDAAVRRFQRGLKGMARAFVKGDLSAARGDKTRVEMARVIGAHNSYHAGQVAQLRRVLGAWPPPSGGLTW
jgi:uncharacterized damage-inducible protein DinB